MKNEPIEMYSPHFSKQEMQRSATAIRLGLDNTPDAEAEANLQALCTHVLEPLFGEPHSQHLKGEAADIHISNKEMGRRYFRYIKHVLDFDQLLFEHVMKNGCMWLHVSYCRDCSRNRHKAKELSI